MTGRIVTALGASLLLATGAWGQAVRPAPADGAAPFVLHEVRFGPSRFLSAADLDAPAAALRGRSVSRADLDRLVAAVNALYDRRGIVTARAVLGTVDAAAGLVAVDLVEGRVGRVTVAGNRRLPAATAIARTGLVAGETVDPPALQRRLSLLNRATDTRYRVALLPGEGFGTTDVRLTVTPPDADVVRLAADNGGYDTAGRYQGSVHYRHTGLLGASDRITAYISGSRGLLTGTASYDAAPFDTVTRLGIAYGHSRTDIVSGPYASLGSRAVIDAVSLTATRPVMASERGLLTASLVAGISSTRNHLAGVESSRSRTHRFGGGLGYSLLTGRTSVTAGVESVHADAPTGAAAVRTGFGVFTGAVAAEQLVGRSLGLRLAGGWQVATVAFVPSDLLFQIGGATTVRGYRQGVLTGDGGYWIGGEAEWFALRRDAATLRLFAFVDHGRVFTDYRQPTGLAAVGLGATAAIGRHLDLKLTVGQPLARVGDERRAAQAFGCMAVTF